MKQKLIRITKSLPGKTLWLFDIELFDNPDTLIRCLEEYSHPATYHIEKYNIWATESAIQKAIIGFESELESIDSLE